MSLAPQETPAKEDDPLVGRTIAGKFVMERRLGAGAMGAVYRAHQTALERPVAIKVMNGAIAADPTYAERFHREAKAASRLDHPNLIRVLDYGQEPDGLLYMAMEFLDGRDLFAVLAEDWPLTHARIVDILAQTLSALAEAHDAGVLHRDLKPENIMLVRRKTEDGTPVDLVKVCDFGIAKLIEPATESTPAAEAPGRKLTTAGLVVGTPEYMSPEQARAESFDARSDLYSIGVVLYQLLTRRLPFEGKSAIEVVFKAMNELPPPLGARGPTVAPGLEAICEKAMSKRPEDRFQSAREMRAALRTATPIDRKLVIGGENRPSMAHAPTQVELVATASSSGGDVVSAAVPGTRRRLPRAAAIVAVALVGAVAVASLRRGAGPAPADRASPPSTASAPLPPTDDQPPSTPPPELVVTETPAPVPRVTSPAHPTGHRATRDTQPPVSTSAAPLPEVPPTPPAPPAVTESPIAAPPPAPSPTPSATPSPAAAAPSFRLETARVDIGQVKSNNAAAKSKDVSRALGPLAARFTGCYRAALAQAGGPASEATATLHLESDDEGYVTVARVTGAVPASAARCIEGLSQRAHIDVDTGTANADVTLTFRPL